MDKYLTRFAEKEIIELLQDFPAVALLGPRQCGKSTLSHYIIQSFEKSVYLDLENPTDLKKLDDPILFFNHYADHLVCMDEVQLRPDLFPVLRSILDAHKRNGQLLLLGSASRDLLQQSSESLAGRIVYRELTPFLYSEVTEHVTINDHWIRGGFPRSLFSRSEKSSINWRKSFIQTYLEKDISQLGFSIPPTALKRLWTMLAHSSGQILNSSRLGESLGVSHTTARSYIDILEQTFMIRVLQPYEANIKKRLIKSPKVYIRNTGILHTLLEIDSYETLLGHPIFGSSWESYVIEEITAHLPDMNAFFYRTSAGAEIDLILTYGNKKIAIECKASSAPKQSKGFWSALENIKPDETWVITPINDSYPIKEGVMVGGIKDFLQKYC
jgi:uncharacterized protein